MYRSSIYDSIQTTKQFNQNTDWIALLPEKQTRQKNTLPGLNQLVVEKQNLIQLVCCVAVHFFGHMRVDAERGADIAMTESALDRLDVNAMLNHHGRRCVSDVMQTKVGKVIPLQESLELAGKSVGSIWFSIWLADHIL